MSNKYKLIGIRPNHKKMREMIGSTLYAICDEGNGESTIEPCLITGIGIGANDKCIFTFDNEIYFDDDEPLFINTKSLCRYAKQKGIKIKK